MAEQLNRTEQLAERRSARNWIVFAVFLVIGIASITRGFYRQYDWLGIFLGMGVIGFGYSRLRSGAHG
ncbi:MAG TPA: hypothetical protein VN577_21275 [Terriglobales bacterium]|nr:hypothetical protein [Terriglobales bacterium]